MSLCVLPAAAEHEVFIEFFSFWQQAFIWKGKQRFIYKAFVAMFLNNRQTMLRVARVVTQAQILTRISFDQLDCSHGD